MLAARIYARHRSRRLFRGPVPGARKPNFLASRISAGCTIGHSFQCDCTTFTPAPLACLGVPPVRAQQCNWVQEPGRGGRESALRGRRFGDRLLWRTPAPCQAGHACGKRRRVAACRAVLVRHAYAEAACWHQLMRAPNPQWGSHEPNAQAWAGHVLRDRELLRVATASA